MEKGYAPAMFVIMLIGVVVMLVVLGGITKPLTTYTAPSYTLANLTGLGYLGIPQPDHSGLKVYNDTNCSTNLLSPNTDYVIDVPYNGDITGATPITGPNGNAISFAENDTVVMHGTGAVADITGDITIIGWVKPKGV